ncbi:MAG: nucleotidyltransferase family protein [Gemmatimonadaceae bacterium]
MRDAPGAEASVIPPEWALSLACARHAAGIASAQHVAEAALDVADWPRALHVARAQGLGALLSRALRDAGAPLATQAVAADAVAVSGARTLGQIRLLTDILAALEEAGVSALPYKGPVLSLQLYGDASLRSSVDLDVVVPRASYAAARKALVGRGLTPRAGHSARQERTLFRWLGHASFGHGTESFVELHWRFAPLQFPFALTPELALARAHRVRLGGRMVSAMSTEDLIVTLAMHAGRHLYERLEWLAGITRLLVAHGDDAASLLAHAHRLRARRTLLVTADVAMRVLDAPLGATWQRALDADPESVSIAATLSDSVRVGWRDGAVQVKGAALQRLTARMLDSSVDRVRSLTRAALLPTEREWEAIALPDSLTPLYHVVRPIRVLAMYARRALGHSPA